MTSQQRFTEPREPGGGINLETGENRLEVVVLHLSARGTRQALRTAARLARGLAAGLRLVAPHIVPYPLPLNAPSISTSFLETRFGELAAEASLPVVIDIRLCRDILIAVESAIPADSIIVLEGEPSWWPSARNRLARRLSRAGRQVVFAGTASLQTSSMRTPCSISSTSPSH